MDDFRSPPSNLDSGVRLVVRPAFAGWTIESARRVVVEVVDFSYGFADILPTPGCIRPRIFNLSSRRAPGSSAFQLAAFCPPSRAANSDGFLAV